MFSQRSNFYREYMLSPQWREKRLAALRRARFRCEICGREGRLEVHHKNYDRLGHERLGDLLVCCPGCHKWADRRRKRVNRQKRLR